MMLISVVKLNGTHQFMEHTDDVNQCGEITYCKERNGNIISP